MTLTAVEEIHSVMLSKQHGIELGATLRQTGASTAEVASEFCFGGEVAATGLLRIEGREIDVRLFPARNGAMLVVRALQDVEPRSRRWALRMMVNDDPAVMQILECGSLTGTWQLTIPGTTVHVQKQCGFVTRSAAEIDLVLGAFTQHGQLLNLRDWFMVERGDTCTGLLALRPGSWTAGAATVARVRGNGDSVVVDLPLESGKRIRRSYAITRASAEAALARQTVGFKDFEPAEGYAVWPARRLAELGFARPERLASYRRSSRRCARPRQLAFGTSDALDAARRKIDRRPELAGGNPFWLGDWDAARAEVFATLRQSANVLAEAGYLHPLGNPVAQRVLAPAFGMFHMLDWEGHLTDAERSEGAELIATLAELLLRRDFYAYHVATADASSPRSVDSLYRGMLNQNFNTDRYATVGLAGCVLRDHPHAGRWRRHAIDQFHEQMRAFVHPGGAWEESHTYANHVKMLLMPLVLALRYAPEGVDLMLDDRFRATCRFFIPLLSPRDVILNGRRGIPGIGDHYYGKHDDFGSLFGWLATMVPEERDAYLWAWHETGTQMSDPHSRQINVFSPLMIPDPDDQGKFNPSSLPALVERTAYGAAIRRHAGSERESLLVIRCGESWAHYHHDQGSFWWWWKGTLVCADSDLGGGPLKFEHHGHNVLGYPNRTPMQYLDRTPFRVEGASIDEDGRALIQCSVPITRWQTGPATDSLIPLLERPHLTRTFEWGADNELTITDEPRRSPDGMVTWSLHVPATAAVRSSGRQIDFQIARGRRMRLSLPADPRSAVLKRTGQTWGVTLEYPEGLMQHHLAIEDAAGT